MAQLQLPEKAQTISIKAGKGMIEAEQAKLEECRVDAIIGNCANEDALDTFIDYAGCEIQTAVNVELDEKPTSTILITPPGDLHCKAIFFVKWLPTKDEASLLTTTIDMIWSIFQNMIVYNYKTVAFSTVGFQHFQCPTKLLVKTLIQQMKLQLIRVDKELTIKFLIESDQNEIYDEICKQILTADDPELFLAASAALPPEWEKAVVDQKRFIVSPTSAEYQAVKSRFDQQMQGRYTRMIKIERIQNERWYRQYMAHRLDFQKRLNRDTEQRLYHGCPESSAISIIEGCFNRSFAGVNGIAIGSGVYFSTESTYSHTFTRPNGRGERCMFIARVLVGQTTPGNSSMKTPPAGYDSTSGTNMFAIFHDAQSYAEYLLTYK